MTHNDPIRGNADPDATILPHLEGEGTGSTLKPPGDRFRVVRHLAKGGLGEVFVAVDTELDREVALKEILARFADNTNSRDRFLREAAITGRLEHPGIVPVYGLGRYTDGRPYYAMRLIRGESLHAAIRRLHEAIDVGLSAKDRSRELRGLLGRFIDVCNAVAYAHSRGVLHRDIKPQNVMLGPFGETLVVDWGLAKVIGSGDATPGGAERPTGLTGQGEAALTITGASLGTPQYMSPEQAEGRWDAIGPASDVYSLGATLYCILTGKAPFVGRDTVQVLHKVVTGDLTPPGQVNRSVPPPLESVCLKAMALKSEDRYDSPRALADDIENWLADRSVSAHRDHPLAWLSRWTRRNKTLVAGAVIFTATAVAGLALNDYGYRGANIIEIILSLIIFLELVIIMLQAASYRASRKRLGEELSAARRQTDPAPATARE